VATTRLELVAGTANKFWEIDLSAKSVVVRWGRIGTKGQTKKSSFKSEQLASSARDKLLAEKKQKGYRDPTKIVAQPTWSREPVLEAAIRADREDTGAIDVYADWLQVHGSPLGELITLQRALATRKDVRKQRRAAAIVATLGLPDPKLATIGWHWGLWDKLRLENTIDWMDASFDALELARHAFGHPACAALRELRIGILRWDYNHDDVPDVIALAGKQPWAADLESLVLGDVRSDIDMAHHVIGVVGKAIAKAFPKLRRLVLHSSEQTWRRAKTFGFAGLVLPELESLTIETCSLSKTRLRELLAAELPKLTELVVWVGSKETGANVTVRDLAPILDGKAFPRVTTLGICNFEQEDALARTIHAAPVARKLVALDLSKSTLDNTVAAELASHAASFPKLERLNVEENFLTHRGIRSLADAFGTRVRLLSGAQREDDDGHRYVAVAE
jgi:uncharacterized protein (TIGR02996 family)